MIIKTLPATLLHIYLKTFTISRFIFQDIMNPDNAGDILSMRALLGKSFRWEHCWGNPFDESIAVEILSMRALLGKSFRWEHCWGNPFDESIAGEILEEEMLIRTLQMTLLWIFCRIIRKISFLFFNSPFLPFDLFGLWRPLFSVHLALIAQLVHLVPLGKFAH